MKNILINTIVVGLAASFVGGIGLATYTDNSSWLILSAVAFLIIYAG